MKESIGLGRKCPVPVVLLHCFPLYTNHNQHRLSMWVDFSYRSSQFPSFLLSFLPSFFFPSTTCADSTHADVSSMLFKHPRFHNYPTNLPIMILRPASNHRVPWSVAVLYTSHPSLRHTPAERRYGLADTQPQISAIST